MGNIFRARDMAVQGLYMYPPSDDVYLFIIIWTSLLIVYIAKAWPVIRPAYTQICETDVYAWKVIIVD